MMTSIMMFGSRVAMATVQAFVRCLRGCSSYNDNRRKKFIQARNHFLQIMFILVYVMNLKWLAGDDYSQRKKSEKLKSTKSGIFG